MDFQLSEEQLILRKTARDFIARCWSAEESRRALDQPPACLSDDVFSRMGDLGWLGVASVGGSGGNVVNAAILAEEAGRHLLPGPLKSALAAVIAVDRCGDERQQGLLSDLVSATRRATLAVEEERGRWRPDPLECTASPSARGWVLNGLKVLVPDTTSADLFLVAARTPDGPGLLLVPAEEQNVVVTAMCVLDARQVSEVHLEHARVGADALLSGPFGPGRTLRTAYRVATVLEAADLLGAMEHLLEITVDYAKERVQFGRPIGSFQAVSHRLADVLADVEIARGLVYGACLAIDEGDPKAAALVSAAKAWVSEAAVGAAETALQLHGGMGYTWESDVHLYLRRARVGAVTYGDADFHRELIAEQLEQLDLDGEGLGS